MVFCTILLWKYLLLFLALGGQNTDFAYSVLQQSHLCKAMDMPCGKGNCDECQMKYYKLNSTDCRDLTFSYDSVTAENKLDAIQIQSYHYDMFSYKQTGFNLTFVNISWSSMKFRFKQEGNEMKNTCREFHMSSNSTIKNLFYDCLWSNESYEGKTFSFEYETRTNNVMSYKKYFFRVPFAKNIDEKTDLANWEIFVFTEFIKNVFGLTTLILHWQPLPEKFSINTYNITVFSNDFGQPKVTLYTKVTCNNIEECKFHYNKWYGSVQFGVQPIPFNESDCLISKTIVFHLGGGNTQSLLIGIVSATLIIPAFIYALIIIRNRFISKTKRWIYSTPKLLIVFTPSLSSHVNVVFALIEYLKMHCNVEPLVDELHIFHSKSRDPFKWCNEAFKSADFVMIVASPYYKSLRLADSVYQNTDVLLLRLLKERIVSKDRTTHFFVLMLPYCSEQDIPKEAINLRRYSFPKDINKMLKFIQKDRSITNCLGSKIQGGRETYKLFGGKLNNAITETQVILMSNKSEYDKMVRETKKENSSGDDPLLANGPKREKNGFYEIRSKGKRSVMRLAEDIFSEFPGRLDDMNLSGEEKESMVESQSWSTENEVVNLDALDL